MNEPRYVVTTVTGWAITPAKHRPGQKAATVAHVLDSAYCYRIVRTFTGHGGNAWRKRPAIEKAQEYADWLNAWDAAQ